MLKIGYLWIVVQVCLFTYKSNNIIILWQNISRWDWNCAFGRCACARKEAVGNRETRQKKAKSLISVGGRKASAEVWHFALFS